MNSNQKPVIISLTAIPSRFSNLPRKIESLLNQTTKAKAIEVYIPVSYRRFPESRIHPPPLPKGAEVIYVDEDLGPATKVLPALEKWESKDVDILICDDDRLQDPKWVHRFVTARQTRQHDIICERGWNISDRFGIHPQNPMQPRAIGEDNGGRTLSYRFKRAMSLGLIHPDRKIYKSAGYVDVFEGFLGALIPSGAMPKKAWTIPDILWTVDDVWLSGMALTNGIGVWAHSQPRPVHSNGKWDKVDSLTNWVEGGVNRYQADEMCVQYLRNHYSIWT